MKKKIIIAGVIILLIGILIGIFCRYHQWKKEQWEQAKEIILQIDYGRQNNAFGMDASIWDAGYQGYENVDEEELYVRLEVYNSWNRQQKNGKAELTVADIEEYLSSAYNEDGTLRVSSIPESIEDYMDWFFADGNRDVEEYWDELERILANYKLEHPEIVDKVTADMSTEQLQELINKYNDPTYEINAEIMGEQE